MVRAFSKFTLGIGCALLLAVSNGCSYDSIDPDSTTDGASGSKVEQPETGSDKK